MIDTEKNISLLNSDRNAVAKANIKELTFPNQKGDRYQIESETNEVASAAIDALQEIEYVKPMKNAYKMIILEGAQEYFVGNRDIDAVCTAIENRLRLALEEKKKE